MSDRDARNTDHPLTANPGYALAQLEAALLAQARAKDPAATANAERRLSRWRSVLEGMSGGSITVGSREPVAGAPAWATLEVAHGGFATGALLAGGPLLPHEEQLLSALPARANGVSARAHLNVHFLGAEGRADLAERLEKGTFRVNVPEEGALLVVVWLMQHGHAERAEELLEAIAPFMDRLRFYPVPDPRPLTTTSVVSVASVGDVRSTLATKKPQEQVRRMNRALRDWLPLYDRVVALFLDTVQGPPPTFVRDANGNNVLRPDRQPVLQGGRACARFPEGFSERACAICATYTELRAAHASAGDHRVSPISPNMALLLGYASTVARNPAEITARDAGRIRRALAGFVTKNGAPGSAKHTALRAQQAAWASAPLHHELARVLGDRLGSHEAAKGLPSLDGLDASVGMDEAARAGAPTTVGHVIPAHLMEKLTRCVEATVDELVRRRIVTSGEVLARIVPQMTSQIRALGIRDPSLRRTYAAIYSAFRRRRSLLLLNLESQVKLDELPWVRALAAFRDDTAQEKDAARLALEQVASLHLTAFPETILPNKLVTELVALAKGAELKTPLTYELAADIFMGKLTPKFLDAAKIAAELLAGSIYERYYALPFDRVRSMQTSDELVELCVELARLPPSVRWRMPADNGAIIEQQQLLTTHNLAALFAGLDLRTALHGDLRHLGERAFRSVCKSFEPRKEDRGVVALRKRKDAAYALRQMLFFLSFVSEDELFAFSVWAEETVAAQPPEAAEKLLPYWRGLSRVLAGVSLERDEERFLGWVTSNRASA